MSAKQKIEIHQSVPGVVLTAENKCSYCKNSKCCTYITIEIDKPKKRSDFDELLWQVSHKNISFYKDEDGWFMNVEAVCDHLGDQGKCGIYETRPTICRDYSNDFCELDEPAEEGFDLHFTNYDELLAYCRKRFKNWDKKWQKKWAKKNG